MPVDQASTASLEGFSHGAVADRAGYHRRGVYVQPVRQDRRYGRYQPDVTSISSDRRILAVGGVVLRRLYGGHGWFWYRRRHLLLGMPAALGFSPIPAVLMCLLANGVPTPYGSIGIPTVSLANLVGLDSAQLASTQMLQLSPFFLIAPFLIVYVAGGSSLSGDASGAKVGFADRFKGVLPLTLASAVAFVLPTYASPRLLVPSSAWLWAASARWRSPPLWLCARSVPASWTAPFIWRLPPGRSWMRAPRSRRGRA